MSDRSTAPRPAEALDAPFTESESGADSAADAHRAPADRAAQAAAGPEVDAAARPELSFVIPMHDEAGNVGPLLQEIADALGGRYRYEVICVDDASRDATAEELEAERARRPELRVLRHEPRAGKAAAMRSGARAARAPLLVLMDGDRQNDPADVPGLIEDLSAARRDDPATALAAGQRVKRADTKLRHMSSRLANGIRGAVLKDGTRDAGCGLKAIDRQMLLALPYFDGQHRFLAALVKAQGGQVVLRDVADRPRLVGRAKYGVWNRLWVGIGDMLAVAWLIRRSHLPQRVHRIGEADPDPDSNTDPDPDTEGGAGRPGTDPERAGATRADARRGGRA
jgi:glycosyltransferase involved in cell wall biosynthesis